MPTHLRPTAPTAPDAIVVGDPGRALLLAQELLQQPKMSNHARGLWGYYGSDAGGHPLTVQSTGIGGPSAALVLSDLAELGVSRAVRIGTCTAVDRRLSPGDLFVVERAIAAGGSAVALGAAPGEVVEPDAGLTERLAAELGESARRGPIASVDSHPGEADPPPGALALDMQTAPLLFRAGSLGIVAAAVLIATERASGSETLEKNELEQCERLAGRAATVVLSG